MEQDELLKQRLKSYMDKEVNKGYRPEVIRKVLLDKGFPEDVVESIYDDVSGHPKERSGSGYGLAFYMMMGVLVLIIGLCIGMVLFFFSGDTCDTAACFIEKADDCASAVFMQDEQGTIYRFESYEDCRIKKEVVAVAEDEPDVIREMFLDKSMVCTHSRGAFDERLVNSLLSGLENCDGELKESIYELAIAQYELTLEQYENG